VLDTFQDLGRDMFLTGLVSSHTGSMSVREGDRVTMSRQNARLGRLTVDDLIEFDVAGDCPPEAPEDAPVHQAIYRATDARAVIFARPPATMALALVDDRLAPAGSEGADSLGTAPVLLSQRPLGSSDVAQLVARTLKLSRVAALRGHGVFAWGVDLVDAFHMVSLLEEMCKIAHHYRAIHREEAQPVIRDVRERASNLSPYRSGNPMDRRRTPPRPAAPRDPGPGPNRRNDGPPAPRTPTDPRQRGGGGGGTGPRRGLPRR
jgi:L-fuculose-phosphate aldolase